MTENKGKSESIINSLSSQNPEPPDDIKRAETKANFAAKKTELRGLQEYFDLRKKWSTYIAWVLFLSLGFVMVVIVLMGTNVLDFSKYTGFPIAMVTGFFAEIVGLAILVVAFLFPSLKLPKN